ncbi:MAG: nucleotidyltransferase family protein [Candidatus Wallbacteria bacterium]|nr:nucleotidyltransferase family protein [Candidatus Wallbacteria bacterium]
MTTDHAIAPRGRVAGVVLAGGDSSRMGRPKALLPLAGSTFLETICARLRDAGAGEIVIVAGSAAEAIRKALPLDKEMLVVNPRPELGQLSSLQVGVRALGAGVPAAIVCLVDHPTVSGDTYGRLIQSWRLNRGSIILPVRNGKHGHPIVLDRRFFAQLLAPAPAATMRAIVHANDEETLDVAVDDSGINADVDTPEDYERLLDSVQRATSGAP